MISIIVSSYVEENFRKFEESVKQTVSSPYEIIRIYNPGKYSISEAYNMGAEKALYDHLCFSHEDLVFTKKDWDKRVLSAINKDNAGVVGIAGSTIKTKIPTGWSTGLSEFDFMDKSIHDEKIKTDEQIKKVKVLDGVILFCRKDVWKEFKFGENVKGFHFYDIDFSLRVSQKYQNYIISGLGITHFSTGKFDGKWLSASYNFHENANGKYVFDEVDTSVLNKIKNYWLYRLGSENISFSEKIKFAKKIGVSGPTLFSFIKLLLK